MGKLTAISLGKSYNITDGDDVTSWRIYLEKLSNALHFKYPFVSIPFPIAYPSKLKIRYSIDSVGGILLDT